MADGIQPGYAFVPTVAFWSDRDSSMTRQHVFFALCGLTCLLAAVEAAEPGSPEKPKSDAEQTKTYGQWTIRVRPDKTAQYNELIEKQGLPLFRRAGGRMVGWWTTLVGELYEHLTIWEYDDFAAFEKAIEHLAQSKEFGEFVAARDPLLIGEANRFMRLAPGAVAPKLPEPAKFVEHVVQRVPLREQQNFLAYMQSEGIALFKKHGFRPSGPWVTDIGDWAEVTWLFAFESLADMERKRNELTHHADGKALQGALAVTTRDTVNRLLVPAPFAKAKAVAVRDEPLAPHEIAPGVFAHGSSARLGSSNIGWIVHGREGWIAGAPQAELLKRALDEVERSIGRPARGVILTDAGPAVLDAIASLAGRRIPVFANQSQIKALRQAVESKKSADDPLSKIDLREPGEGVFDAAGLAIRLVELSGADTAVWLPEAGVLFTGQVCVNGPRAEIGARSTSQWIAEMARLERLVAPAEARVVPGAGTIGDAKLLSRQRRFLAELRRQVAHRVAQGQPLDLIQSQVSISPEWLVWMPYDHPTAADVEQVYRELTVPNAPFGADGPPVDESRPQALVLIGDRPHDPEHLEAGLRRLFDTVGVLPHFAYDVRTLSAENLRPMQLLVMLRDGMLRPSGNDELTVSWMTPEQETAIVQFVESGKSLLALHNSTGLYPDKGPYLKLVGGTYEGHGPLERFRVNVVDRRHPITRGVEAYEIADEQHTPAPDLSKVHVLLASQSDDGVQGTAGWAYEAGRGRVAYLANGHTRESLVHPMYQLLLQNATRWCLRMPEAKE